MIPTCFISYSWDSDQLKGWVKGLAADLRSDGVDVKLDQWEAAPGDQLPHFMEKSIRENNYVLIICTPNYKVKSDNRKGGVGYEGDIMTAEVFQTGNHKKFIPLLKEGNVDNSMPCWLQGKYYIDFTGPDSENPYNDLLTTLRNERETAPPIGKSSRALSSLKVEVQAENYENVRIKGVVVDEVTSPKNDGSRGSALYKIPFELSRTPSYEWGQIFVNTWNNPPRFTNMHRPGIASVIGNKIYLDGTTIEEVEKYHRDTLVLVIEEVNEKMKQIFKRKQQESQERQKKEDEHRKNIDDISGRIEF